MENKDIRRYIRRTLGFFPLRVSLYRTALIHKSHSTDDLKGHKINNERLEYLGDSVLGTVVAEYLYHRYPYKGEGYLTEMRSKIVGRASLNRLATQMGLEELIDVERTKAFTFKSLGGNTFEALVGAIYLDRGYDFAKSVIIDRIVRVQDRIDAGLNPLGLSDQAIPFDISPAGASDGTHTHYEQVRDRAKTALANARKLLDRAQTQASRMRMISENALR